MARPPIDPSGPLVTVTARLPAPQVELLDLLALAMSRRDDRPVSRGEALRRLVAPIFDGLERAQEVREGLRRAQRESLAAVRAMPLAPRPRPSRRPPAAVARAAEALDELGGGGRKKRPVKRTKGSKHARKG